MSHSNPGAPNLTPPTSRFPWVATIIATVLGLAGLGLLGYAIFSVNEGGEARAATPTQLVLVPTRVLAIPTTTPAPTSTTPAPTSAPTEAQATTPTPAGATLQITLPANVRSGPGTNYSIIGGLPVGSTPTVVGRDATAEWYVISDASLTGGQGWVSNTVASYSGDASALPVITAPSIPPTSVPPTATRPANTAPPAPTSTPSVYSSRGIVGNFFSVENPTAAAGQDIWFNFKVTNASDTPVSYSVLAAHSDSGPSARSWTNETLGAHAVLEWRDHININTPGAYDLYLGICYGGRDACLANNAPWDRLSPSITVTVQ